MQSQNQDQSRSLKKLIKEAELRRDCEAVVKEMVKEKLAARMARVQLSRQMKKEKKERREVILQVVFDPSGSFWSYR